MPTNAMSSPTMTLLPTTYVPRGHTIPLHGSGSRSGAACAAGECKDHTQLWIALIDDAVACRLPGDCTFDCSLTSAPVRNHMQSQQRAYVGDLKLNRHGVYDGREPSLQAVAR